MRARLPILVVAALLLAPAWASAQLSVTGSTPALEADNGGPDGVVAGDMDGDGDDEVAWLIRRGRHNTSSGTSGVSSLVVFDAAHSSGTMSMTRLFEVQPSQDMLGFPTMGDFDGDGQQEVGVCELAASNGACRVYDGDGSELTAMRVTGLSYASMTNGGPTAADLNGDGYDDLIVGTYGGTVVVKPGNGVTGFTYDLWTQHSDWLFGHIAVGDVDGDGSSEIVAGGAGKGAFYAIRSNGTLLTSSSALWNSGTNSGYFYYGSGPTLADLDGDSDMEIISILDYYGTGAYGASPQLLVHDVSGSTVTLTARISLPAAASFTSPVVGNLGGDAAAEIIVLDNAGTLRSYSYDGSSLTLSQSAALGDGTWSTPALVDSDGDGDVEVIAATSSGAYVLDDDLNVTHQWSASAALVFPQPILADADGDGQLELFSGTWNPAQLVGLDLPFSRLGVWTALGGSATRTGSVPVSGSDVVSDNPSVETWVVLEGLVTLSNAPGGCNVTSIQSARNSTDLAHRQYLLGNPHTSVAHLQTALSHLASAASGSCDVDYWMERTARAAHLTLEQYLNRAIAAAGASDPSLVTASNHYANAEADLALGAWTAAVADDNAGAAAVRTRLDAGVPTIAGECNTTDPEIFLYWMCELIAVREAVQADPRPGRGGQRTAYDNTLEQLRLAIAYSPDLIFGSSFGYARTAMTNFQTYTGAAATTARKTQLTRAIERMTRLFLNNAQDWFSEVDPSALANAEVAYASGNALLDAGNPSQYANALLQFVNVYNAAKPCTGSSFASPAQGLADGGCTP